MVNEKRAVMMVFAAVLIDTIGFGIVIPVLPALIMRVGHVDLEAATRIAGYLVAVFALTQFFAGPVLGNLADRFGRRPVLMFSMLAFAANYALMALADSLLWLFVGRALAGVAGAVYAPANAVIADVTPPAERARRFGLMSAAFGVGFVIGPAIGGLLAGLGPRAPFIAAAVIAGANALTMLVLLPETLTPENRRPFDWRRANIIASFRPVFAQRAAAPLLVALFLWQLAYCIYPATWSFWATARLNWDGRAIGLSLAYVGVIMAAVQIGLTGRAIKRLGERGTAVFAMIAGIVTFALYALVQTGFQAYALFLIGGFAGMATPALNGMLSRMAGASEQGALQGGLGSLGTVATIIATVMLTQALAAGVARGFPGAAFLLASALGLLALLALLATRRQQPAVA
ncbi:MFS transporter [Sphingomonas sp.]|uniref:MFS transporter n=1 Tax=Sphingomonas sp. TaxID=28214 RepID=UPI001DFC0860|nr:MFS transporter [Sphingomonas sp.]MBX9797697.1 MFS transporter [Sphingomonas sp.]